jgi:hypothetical protein
VRTDSFIEIGRHSERMLLVLDTVEALAHHASLLPLLGTISRQKTSIVNLLGALAQSVGEYTTVG